MEDNNTEDDGQKYWFSDKPAVLIVIAGIVAFPFVLAYWGLATAAKQGAMKRADRRWVKAFGRHMTGIEQVLYKMELDKKFMI